MDIDKAYDAWSAQYDTNANKTRDLEKIAAQTLLADVRFEHVLELGCGTGKNSVWLAGRASTFTGLDFSTEMLRIAKERLHSTGISFRRVDLNAAWGIAPERMDLVTCSLVLEHIEDLRPVFRKAAEVLLEGGHFYVGEFHPFRQYQGKKARYEGEFGTVEVKAFVHHVTDYTIAAQEAGFRITLLREWWDQGKEEELPRLLSFLFEMT